MKVLPARCTLLVPFLALAACHAPGAASTAVAPEALRISQDVRWLADDARDGRRAATGGEEAAARWIAQRLEALGLEPAGTDGFLQPFECPLPVRDGGTSALEVRALDQLQRLQGEGLVPLFCSAGSEAEGRLVFAGYGITDADLGRDDYAGLDVKDAVVLVVRGTPPDALLPAPAAAPAGGEAAANPHGGPAPKARGWGGAGAVFTKVMEAKRRGAKAVLLAQHPTSSEPMLAFGEGGGAEARIPALHLSAAKADELLPGFAARVAVLDVGEAQGQIEERTVNARADVVRARGTARNVLGRIRGEDSTRVLLVGAHFDHLGRGGAGSLAPDQQGEIHNGADDNASGTAVVLELARCLAAAPKPACDVVLALWSGEELGLLGSEHWARNPTFPLTHLIANVNLDMVGRAESNPVAVLGAGSAAAFAPILSQAGPRAGFELSVSLSGQGVGGSDHQTFLKREIPALHVFTGLHSDYHRPSDDHERFEAEGARKVANLVLDLVDALPRQSLAFVPAPKETTPSQAAGGFKTRFGSIPDYAFAGPGMRLDGTSPGGPAEKAGLLRGDVLLGIGDTAIEGIGDFMFVLNTHKPGDVLTVRFLRDGSEERVQVTLESTQVE
jgi:hypothetical protein